MNSKLELLFILFLSFSIVLTGCSKYKPTDYGIIKVKECQETCSNAGGLYNANKVIKENDTHIDMQCNCNIYINISKE